MLAADVESGGACPFECCAYGEWEAVTPIPALVAEGNGDRGDGPPAFTLEPGEAFEAVTGHVRVERPGIVGARGGRPRPETTGRRSP